MSGEIPFLDLVLVAAILFAAGLVHGTLGLGFPLVATPLLALFMDVRSAILITLVPTATVNVASILRGGHWRDSLGRFWPLAAYALAGGTAGSALIVGSDPAPFKLALAALIVLYLASGRFGRSSAGWAAGHPGWAMMVFGLAAGVSAGATNVMVPILIIFALEMGLRTTAMVQVFNMCFLAGKASQMVVFAGAGMLTRETVALTAPLAGVALLALLIGMSVRERISAESYRAAMKWVLLVVAVVLVVQYFSGPAD